MADDIQQQLRLVEQELNLVTDQINTLLERQERLREQQAELLVLLESCGEASALDRNGAADNSGQERNNWSGAFHWDAQADEIRLNIFGIPSYRKNQKEIINAVLSGRDVIVIMAAGGGKSLCYQLPALLRPGTALVISPLISLIQDQVMGLTSLGIPASMLTSTTSKDEETFVYKVLEKGEGELRVLYVTPEKVAKSKRFMSKLEKCNHAGRLSLIAIDEAHCCSQWGHDFRPDYKSLGILKKQFAKVPMIALTATATERVQADLRAMLQISRCEKFVSSVNRPNLFYEVREKKSNANAAMDDIADFIRETFPGKESGIVYCFSRKECEQVAAGLRKKRISAAHYHADMNPAERESVHRRWSSNKLQVIVGTVAFGMGINKPDVRFVIHHTLSKSLETYYQESGRAGRDGLPSLCLLFFRPADLPRQSCMVFAEMAGLHNLYSIAKFCLSKRSCRHAAFFLHFGERVQECNGMCDNCAYGKNVVDMDVTAHARSLVSLVQELDGLDKKQTMLQLVETWRSRTRQAESGQQSEAKLVKDLSKEDVERMISHLVLEGVLKEEFQHTAYSTNAYICLSAEWRSLLQGDKPFGTLRSMCSICQFNLRFLYYVETGKKKITLEIVQGVTKRKACPKMGNMSSGMVRLLDELRQELANKHGGIFPHAVLSSQHIEMLCSNKPNTLGQLEELIGKRKVEQYGVGILSAIQQYVAQNPGSPLRTGEWVCPKDGHSVAKTSTSKKKQPPSMVETPKSSTDHELICIDTDSGDPDTEAALVGEEEDEDFIPVGSSKRQKPKE